MRRLHFSPQVRPPSCFRSRQPPWRGGGRTRTHTDRDAQGTRHVYSPRAPTDKTKRLAGQVHTNHPGGAGRDRHGTARTTTHKAHDAQSVRDRPN